MTPQERRLRRHRRVRQRVHGTKERPRLSVFRSHRALFAQLINDDSGRTILGIREPKGAGTKVDRAKTFGVAFGKMAVKKKIQMVMFDRGGYMYHGRVAAFAAGAREGGLIF